MNATENNREIPTDDLYYSCNCITDMQLVFNGEVVKQKNELVALCCEPIEGKPLLALGETGEETILNYLNIRKILLQESQISFISLRTVSKGCAKCARYNKKKQKPSEKITRVNFSPYPSPCNAKCIYCGYSTDKFTFSAAEAEGYQKVFDAVEYAQTVGLIFSDTSFFMGTGEITIHPYKQRILDIVKKNPTEFGTNCFLFDEQIAKNLKSNPKSLIYFSIDSGTKETWKKIKGAANFDKVTDNLLKYRENCVRPGQIKLKYIIMPGINDDIKDFTGCIELMKSLGVSFLEISRDTRHKYSITARDNENLMKAAALFVIMLSYNGMVGKINLNYTPVQKKRIVELTQGLV